ncbi:hypothetical protein N9B94_01915 [Verrucomicrobia bacterium]|nr:hypothetical protein [Verrucomicrobiota bacterium]
MKILQPTMMAIALMFGSACSDSQQETSDGSGQETQQPESQGVAMHETKQVVLEGGHETNPVDRGRPVALIGPALGVTPEIFRKAFSSVTPARGGHPSQAEARANKQALMSVLAPHGINNDRLDEVSNFYRYQPQNGGLWPHSDASVTASIKGGNVTGFVITDAGYGYTVAPNVTVAGFPSLKVKATLEFSTEFKQNGRLSKIEIIAAE